MTTPFPYLASADLTDVGRRRKNNEDSLIRLPDAGIFCVADGMGGVQGGEIASKACVDALRKEFTETPEAPFALTADASARLVERALNGASKWIKTRAESLGMSGTGSTAVVLVFDRVTPSQGIALHAGDSRAYRLRGDKLAQITADHSVAAAAGLPDDSSLPPMFRGVITRAVGLERRVELEYTPFDVVPGDVFLICSDGLSKMVNDKRITKLVRKHIAGPLEAMARALVDEALEAGGDDNVSVVLIQVAAELPKGPTMEVPPETLALEQLVVVPDTTPAATPHQGHDDDLDHTGQTAESSGRATACTVAETVVTTPSGQEGGVTPVTPDGDGKPATPTTPATPTESRGPAPVAHAPLSSAPARGRGKGGLLLVLFVLVLVAAAVLGVLQWRAGKLAFLTKQPAERPPAPSIDLHHGVSE